MGTDRIGRIAFLGTGAFGVPLFSRVAGLADELLVVSQPDRPAGRRLQLRATPIAVAARERGIRVVTPTRLRSEAARAELAEFDPGPPPEVDAIFKQVPTAYGDHFKYMWWKFGPVYYRGRPDKTARLLIIASDPGPTECLPFVRRCLVGDSGQRVQGLITKLGLTRSYVCMNAFAFALFPSSRTTATSCHPFA